MTLALEIYLFTAISAYPVVEMVRIIREHRRRSASGRFYQAQQASEYEAAYRSQLAALANLAGGSAACTDFSPAAISDSATSDVEAARNTGNTSKQKEKA